MGILSNIQNFFTEPTQVSEGYGNPDYMQYKSSKDKSSQESQFPTGKVLPEGVDGFTGADVRTNRKNEKPFDIPKDVPREVEPLERPQVGPDAEQIKKEMQEDAATEVQEMQTQAQPKPNYKEVVSNPYKTAQAEKSFEKNKADAISLEENKPLHTEDEYLSKYNTEVGRQNGDFQNANTEWYEDRSFYQGLLRWGVGVLGGEDYGQAFDAANNVYETNHSQDQRRQWADEMSDEYDPRSIQKWIETGDEKDLSSYASMADRDNERQMKVEQMQSRLSVGDTRDLNRMNIQQKAQDLKNSEDRAVFAANSETRAQQTANRNEREFALKQKAAAQKAQQLNGGKPPTEGQAKDMGYAATMYKANEAFSDTTRKDEDAWLKANPGKSLADKNQSLWTEAAKTGVMNADGVWADAAAQTADPVMRQRFNNEKMFTMSLLRKQSGATITENEWKRMGQQYFPRPGDTKEQLETKAQQRRIALVGMRASTDSTAARIAQGFAKGQFMDTKAINGVDFVKGRDGKWYKLEN